MVAVNGVSKTRQKHLAGSLPGWIDHLQIAQMDSTWAMKKKPDGNYKARNAIQGFIQQDRKHFDSHDKPSPAVVTTVGIRIAMALTLMGGWYQHLVDVEGAFLNGVFQHPEKYKLYVKIPEAYQH